MSRWSDAAADQAPRKQVIPSPSGVTGIESFWRFVDGRLARFNGPVKLRRQDCDRR